MDIKTCRECGKRFLCFASDDCWCARFPEILIDHSKDCLCPVCLKKEALKQGYKEEEIPDYNKGNRVLITIEKVNGTCPVFNVGDKILIHGAEVDLKNSDAFCIHAAQALLFYALPIREGVEPATLGLAVEGDKAFVHCPDPGPPFTDGGSVIFSLIKI